MPRIHKTIGSRTIVMAEVLGLTGMTAQEAAEFLTASGIKASLAAVKAWRSGGYNPPLEALELLWRVVRAVLRPDDCEMPDGVPASVLQRAEAFNDMEVWWTITHPEPSEPGLDFPLPDD